MVSEPQFMRDVQIDIFRNGRPDGIGTGIRVRHLPTGIVAEGVTDGTKRQLELKAELIDELGRRLSAEHPCELSRFGPSSPIAPVPAEEPADGWPEPHHYPYRVC